MTSERKIAANRKNCLKSSGPRTAAGKSKASRNALRHGLAAIIHRRPPPSAEIELLAKSICGNDDDPALLQEARTIAENEMALRMIRMQQIAFIERLRERTATALAHGDDSLDIGKARWMQGWLAHREIGRLVPILLDKYKDQTTDDDLGEMLEYKEHVPLKLKVLLEPVSELEEEVAIKQARNEIEERDEHQSLKAAAPDLERLERYERRAQSRQTRAIDRFIQTKFG